MRNGEKTHHAPAAIKAITNLIRPLIHHLTCKAVWAYPWDGPCTYRHCGNWLRNSTTVPARKETSTP